MKNTPLSFIITRTVYFVSNRIVKCDEMDRKKICKTVKKVLAILYSTVV